ncbi:MAG: TatD family hydrolase [Victivallales bacterium]|nr:TatD family hydrolase [Victivallales bacterium]
MIDFHCHLDLYHEPMKVFAEVQKKRDFVLAVTTSPKAYQKTSYYFKGTDTVKVALGFHPELVAQRSVEIALFFELIHRCKYLGEIGIDGSPRAKSSLLEQKRFFREAVINANLCGGRIMSIHSRYAVRDVLDILEGFSGQSKPVLHWFTGTKTDVLRAVSIGCWFSINPNMCYTQSGRENLGCIPLDKLLPETDAPFTQIDGKPYMPWNTSVTTFLAHLYGMQYDDMSKQLQKNLYDLIGSML